MSARTPFVPLPAALAGRPKDAPHFVPDHSNPLHAAKQNSLPKLPAADGFQPLNLGGLKKGKLVDSLHAGLIPRPGTAMLRSSDQQSEPNRRLSHRASSFGTGNIFAPTPRQAAVSGPVILSEPPSMEADCNPTVDTPPNQNENNAHISDITGLPNSGLVESRERDDHEALGVAMKGIYAGPRRLLAHSDTDIPSVVDPAVERSAIVNHTSQKQVTINRKRPHSDNDKRMNHHDQFGPPLKQPKLSQHNADQPREPPPPFGYPDQQNDLLPWAPVGQEPPQGPSSHSNYPRRHEPPQNSVHRALFGKLFGCDTDTYIKEHTEKYDAAYLKWQDSSFEDWEAGADEITAKFGQVLEFAKTHMTAKLRLFTTFDDKIAAHKATLHERDKVLVRAKDRLVKDSGNFLGR